MMKCPQCGGTEWLQGITKVWMRVSPNQNELMFLGDTYRKDKIPDSNSAECENCGGAGTAGELKGDQT